MVTNYETVESALAATWSADSWRDVNVVVAVSGGADSVALLRALASAKKVSGGIGCLFVGHFDHRLRPESAEDSTWLADLCRQLQLPLETGAADVASVAADRGDGVEDAARNLRYAFLRQTAEQVGARYVAAAHTRDDQVETVLHRMIRGTGLAGLAGMPSSRPLSESVTLVRPLLQVTRVQVLDFLQRIGQQYRIDPSNAQERFTRNRLRRRLLPMLRSEFNADVDTAILRLADQAAAVQEYVVANAEVLLETTMVVSINRVEIDADKLGSRPTHLIREACKLAWKAAGLPLQSMGFDQWDQLASLISDNSPRSLNLPGATVAACAGGQVVIAQNA